jgi:hypothetical protein
MGLFISVGYVSWKHMWLARLGELYSVLHCKFSFEIRSILGLIHPKRQETSNAEETRSLAKESEPMLRI